MIKLYNRQTGKYEIEKIAGSRIITYLYGTKSGKMGLEFLLKRKLFSMLSGFFCETGFSRRKIKGFITSFEIDMTLYEKSAKDFKNFNDFFSRKRKPEALTFCNDPNRLLSPGDGRLRAWADIDINRLLQIKGSFYSLGELIQDKTLASAYNGGVCLLLRLAPTDYHRIHFSDNALCEESNPAKGHYYSVNPFALASIASVFCKNKRECAAFHSANFGSILYVEVGATSVGSIVQLYSPGKKVYRGDEKALFKFGGSTVLLFLKRGTAMVDADILSQTEMGDETMVAAGEAIGRKPII